MSHDVCASNSGDESSYRIAHSPLRMTFSRSHIVIRSFIVSPSENSFFSMHVWMKVPAKTCLHCSAQKALSSETAHWDTLHGSLTAASICASVRAGHKAQGNPS